MFMGTNIIITTFADFLGDNDAMPSAGTMLTRKLPTFPKKFQSSFDKTMPWRHWPNGCLEFLKSHRDGTPGVKLITYIKSQPNGTLSEDVSGSPNYSQFLKITWINPLVKVL